MAGIAACWPVAAQGPAHGTAEKVIGVRGTGTRAHWRSSLARRIGLDANPLRRGIDRAETWARIAAVVVFAIVAPLAAAGSGHWASAAAGHSARIQASSVHQVPATLSRSVPASVHPARSALSWVPAQWTAPDGRRRTGNVQAPPGAKAGGTVHIWVDDHGQVTGPPLTHAQVITRVIAATVLTPVAIAIVLVACLALLHLLAEHRRLAAWGNAWSAVEPRWTKRLR